MEDEIKAGDLVVVDKATPCCNETDGIGKVFKVAEVDTRRGHCRFCNKIWNAWIAHSPAHDTWFDARRLKKIHPLSDHEIIEAIEEMKV